MTAVLTECVPLPVFYGMWTPDLFMKRVEADADWSLFCP